MAGAVVASGLALEALPELAGPVLVEVELVLGLEIRVSALTPS